MILSRQHFLKPSSFTSIFDHVTVNIQINSRGIHCTKFGNFQGKGSNSIEQTSLRLQTDTLNNMSFLKKKNQISFWKTTKTNQITHADTLRMNLKLNNCSPLWSVASTDHLGIWVVALPLDMHPAPLGSAPRKSHALPLWLSV